METEYAASTISDYEKFDIFIEVLNRQTIVY